MLGFLALSADEPADEPAAFVCISSAPASATFLDLPKESSPADDADDADESPPIFPSVMTRVRLRSSARPKTTSTPTCRRAGANRRSASATWRGFLYQSF